MGVGHRPATAEPAVVRAGGGCRRRERAPAAGMRDFLLDHLRRGGGFTVRSDGTVCLHDVLFCKDNFIMEQSKAAGVVAGGMAGDVGDSSMRASVPAATTSRQRRSAARNTRAAFLQREQKRHALSMNAEHGAATDVAATEQPASRLAAPAATQTTATTTTTTTMAAAAPARRAVASATGKRRAVEAVGGTVACERDVEVAAAAAAAAAGAVSDLAVSEGMLTRALAAMERSMDARRAAGRQMGRVTKACFRRRKV